jgi:hypothetical protein
MGKNHTQATAVTAKTLSGTVEAAKSKPEWETPVVSKLPAVEAMNSHVGSGADSRVWTHNLIQ